MKINFPSQFPNLNYNFSSNVEICKNKIKSYFDFYGYNTIKENNIILDHKDFVTSGFYLPPKLVEACQEMYSSLLYSRSYLFDCNSYDHQKEQSWEDCTETANKFKKELAKIGVQVYCDF